MVDCSTPEAPVSFGEMVPIDPTGRAEKLARWRYAEWQKINGVPAEDQIDFDDLAHDWSYVAEDEDSQLGLIKEAAAILAFVDAELPAPSAAAPDLLAACKEFLPILERQVEDQLILCPDVANSRAFKCASERVGRMRAAIAKAEGQPSPAALRRATGEVQG